MSHVHNEDEIEGLIFKEKGVWIAEFFSSSQPDRKCRCQVDFCPWCGERLE